MFRIGIVDRIDSEDSISGKLKYINKLMTMRNNMDLICFPEMFLISDYREITYDIIKKLELVRSTIREKTIESGVAISYGTIVSENDNLYIAQIICLPDNREYEYRKMVLGKNEEKHFEKGNEICSFKYKGINFGVLLCIESHLPELTYIHKRLGCQVMLVPFKMPGNIEKRLEIWDKYIPARSYDYNIVHVCNNYYGGIYASDGKGDSIDIIRDELLEYIEIDCDTVFNRRINYYDYSRDDLIEEYIVKFRTGDNDDTSEE